MMNFKKFSVYFVFVMIVFVAINALVWQLFTSEILTRKQSDIMTGDMSRMGYLPHLNHERKNSTTLKKKHLNSEQYSGEKVDMITLGDSFSQGNTGGLNRYYQDYFATYLNMDILNIHELPKSRNYIETIVMLHNSGELKKLKPKYILIESTQRKVVSRLSMPIDYTTTSTNLDYYKKKNNSSFTLPKVSFINNGNFKYLAYTFLYNFSDRAFISKVHHVKLNQKLFSIQEGDDLLYYNSDIRAIKKHSKENLITVNANLNKLALLLKQQDIQLIFMPAVGKYDLYHDYIIDNNYAKDPFFDYLRPLKKDYIFLDTKKILLNEVKNGVKDVFYVDDTHWSYKASDAIA
ncbi:MAG: hypothetical protein U9N30_10755, partial [Campylobacterota bacterium]|nr:hypothetical protein [Campylobacterota bacterium]